MTEEELKKIEELKKTIAELMRGSKTLCKISDDQHKEIKRLNELLEIYRDKSDRYDKIEDVLTYMGYGSESEQKADLGRLFLIINGEDE